ncbi:T9SS type A sorting domain-containing protein [bacterium]|nr:T9SS type A sorting domain-containing protein [bacterium]
MQHVDADGYTAFSTEGVPVSDSLGCWLFGIEPGLDGDCVVLFSRDIHGEPDRLSDVFAQRITQQGERLWGQGINASVTESQKKVFMYSYGHWTVSDDSGGIWAFWRPAPAENAVVYICGVNADGTLKYPEGDPCIGTTHMSLTRPNGLRVADGEGGVAVLLTEHADGYYAVRHIYIQHVLADGSLLYDEPQLVLDWPQDDINSYVRPYQILRDPQGGYVVTSERYWQRVSDDLTPQWDIRGVRVYDCEPLFQLEKTADAVVLSDRSVLQIGFEQGEDEPRLEQLDFDGNRIAGNGWGPYAGDSTFYPTGPGPQLLSPDGQSLISMFRGSLDRQNFDDLIQLVQCISPSGDNLWPEIRTFGNEVFNWYSSDWSMFYVDDEHLCYVMGDGFPQDYRVHFAFKGSAVDGSIIGVDSAVPDNPVSPARPDTPAFISNAYPNPFNSSIALTISVQAPGIYDLVVHNVLGQTIHREAVDIHAPGEFVQTLTLPEGSASGIYFLTLQLTDGRHLSQKKVVYLR